MKVNNEMFKETVKEINDYIISEYGTDPGFTADDSVVDKMTEFDANLHRMGIIDFKVTMTIGRVYGLIAAINGREIVDISQDEAYVKSNKIINDALHDSIASHPNQTPEIKNVEMLQIPVMLGYENDGRIPQSMWSTKHLLS